ncbi:MAG: ATP synthase F1 subunit gamma [Crocinitomicaceae bacterium]|nr:ATP synthase F1 subunit gamma [Crocinitomicaceae bacterium]
MANLKEIRSRITSVNSTMQITSAMKMVSAAKLKRAQDTITRMRPYADKLQEILSNVSSSLSGNENKFSRQREVKNVLIVAITSNRGLCGGFNNNVIKEIRYSIREQYAGTDVKVVSLGKKAFDFFKRSSYHTNTGFGDTPYSIFDNLTFDNSSAIAKEIMEQFSSGKWDKVVLVYNRFKNAAVQQMMHEQFLPVLPPVNQEAGSSKTDYIFEPDKEQILENLIPGSLKIQLFKALLDSNAAEHGARMTAMHKATDNAHDLVKELKLNYNKARQASITGEILEIVAGAEALKG